MSKIRVSFPPVATLQVVGQPFGGKYLFKVGDIAQISSDPESDFDTPSDGTYTASCQSLDVNGAPIPDLVTAQLTLQNGQIVVDVPPQPETYPAPGPLAFQILPS